MTDQTDRLAEIEARCEAATAGPWWVEKSDGWFGKILRIIKGERNLNESAWNRPTVIDAGLWSDGDEAGEYEGVCDDATAFFIANARQDIPYMLDLLREKDAEIARGRAPRLGRYRISFGGRGADLALYAALDDYDKETE